MNGSANEVWEMIKKPKAYLAAAPAAVLALAGGLIIFALEGIVSRGFYQLLLILIVLGLCSIPYALWIYFDSSHRADELAQASALIESAREHAIFLLDPQGRVETWNLGAQKMKGYAADEICGRSFEIFYTREDRETGLPAHHLREASVNGHLEYEGWRVRKDGSRFWARVTLNAVRDGDGKLVGFSKVTQNATERRQAEERISHLNDQLLIQIESLQSARAELESRNRQLAAVNSAISAISGTLAPDENVLQRIVDSARDLVESRYGALGVADENGLITHFITSGISPAEREAIGPLPRGHGLLGALIQEPIPIRLAHIADDPRSSGFPPNHPPMESLLGVPITYQDQIIGNLYMTDKRGAAEFTEDDRALLILLAGHAAVAITNSRLYFEAHTARERLELWNARLEQTVAERTHEIQRYAREMTGRILEAQESERQRIARELHDETAQSLATLLINIDLVDERLGEQGAEVSAGIDRLRSLARRTLDETRALSHNLRPAILDDVGLSAALEWLADDWSRSYPVDVSVDAAAYDSGRLMPSLELTLYRVTQEALANVAKHSGATSVDIVLESDGPHVVLTVSDDGTGFDVAAARPQGAASGLGLFGMRERLDHASGVLSIESKPGQGTTIIAKAPVEPSQSLNQSTR
jgi:PAS domain S-box-containing protein